MSDGSTSVSLQLLGLPQGTEQVYRMMLREPSLGVEELARELRMTPDAVRGELDELARFSLLAPQDGKPGFVLQPPDQALDRLIAAAQQRADEHLGALTQLRAALPELVDDFLGARSSGGLQVEVLDSAALVRSRLFELTRHAREMVSWMVPTRHSALIDEQQIVESERMDLELLRRGVSVQIITPVASLGVPHWLAYLHRDAAAGVRVRVHDAPPLSMIIIDNGTAVLPRRGRPGAAVVRDEDVVLSTETFFNWIWRDSTPLDVATTAESRRVLSGRQQQVLHLMAEGLTDEGIARRMRCSTRTVGRLVSEITAALQVESRFQAGLVAAREGLLADDPGLPREP